MTSEMDNSSISDVSDNDDYDRRQVSTKKPHKYSSQEDVLILREVASHLTTGPLTAKIWSDIFNTVKIPVKDGKALQRRYNLLLKYFSEKNHKSLRGSSGLEEDYNEEIHLLEEIQSLVESYNIANKNKTEKKLKKIDSDKEAGEMIRDAALRTIKRDAEFPPEKSSKRNKKEQILDLIKSSDKNEHDAKLMDLEFKKQQLEVQKKQLSLQEKEFELKKENDAHRREMEKRRMEMDQQKMESDLAEKRIFLTLLSGQKLVPMNADLSEDNK